jgi:hypothetical protein
MAAEHNNEQSDSIAAIVAAIAAMNDASPERIDELIVSLGAPVARLARDAPVAAAIYIKRIVDASGAPDREVRASLRMGARARARRPALPCPRSCGTP